MNITKVFLQTDIAIYCEVPSIQGEEAVEFAVTSLS
jgi:hypothetical protein